LDLTRRTTVRTRKLDVDFEKYFEVALGIEDVRRSGVQGCAAKQIVTGRRREWLDMCVPTDALPAGSKSPAECPGSARTPTTSTRLRALTEACVSGRISTISTEQRS